LLTDKQTKTSKNITSLAEVIISHHGRHVFEELNFKDFQYPLLLSNSKTLENSFSSKKTFQLLEKKEFSDLWPP